MMGNLLVTDSKESFQTWICKEFVYSETRDLLLSASILIVPFENLRPNTPPVFPIGTDDLYRYFKANLAAGLSAEICIDDSLYQEFAFYSDYKRLGNFVVKAVAIPVFVTILSAYVYDKFIKEDESKPQIQVVDQSTRIRVDTHVSVITEKKYLEPTHIKFSVTVVDTLGTSKKIEFEGPAKEIDTALKALKEYEK